MAVGDFDYIIVGSGAGGGPLAANLARAGFQVLLLEAGGDPSSENDLGRLMYQVPIFNALASEYDQCSWNYYVRHYANDAQQQRDSKYIAKEDGVWYPRASALGGCTAHNAMITVVPSLQDWDHIAELTGDASWRAANMLRYFERLENCTYQPQPGTSRYLWKGLLWSLLGLWRRLPHWWDWAHGHGFHGWLTTSEANPELILADPQMIRLLLEIGGGALHEDPAVISLSRIATRLDPNDLRNLKYGPEGLALTPLAVANGRRNGPREFLLQTRNQYPANLTIQLGALATKILFESKRAIGVEFLEGRHLYQADPLAVPAADAPKRQVRAGREVILAAGAFNSPQLLMLSGIGPAGELNQWGIPSMANLPGVGQNLQDRYEISVVSEFSDDFSSFKGASFAPQKPGDPPDPLLKQWEQGKGIYTSNGSLVGIVKRSKPGIPEPDLYIFGLPATFRGYVPGYAEQTERFHNRFTWAIVKAYTNNTAGQVKLRSPKAWDTPSITFHYFSESNDVSGADLDAVLAGVEFVRSINKGTELKEIVPGPNYTTPEQLRQFIQNEAWGHHASCSNRIGAENDPAAVVDSRFRVRGVAGLRVVDASVFPRIPGYFIAAAIFMISEKAVDVIVEDAKS